MFTCDDDLAAHRLNLPSPDIVCESEYRHILEFLGTMITNAESEGKPFGDQEAFDTLENLEGQITDLKATFAKRIAAKRKARSTARR